MMNEKVIWEAINSVADDYESISAAQAERIRSASTFGIAAQQLSLAFTAKHSPDDDFDLTVMRKRIELAYIAATNVGFPDTAYRMAKKCLAIKENE